MHERLSVYLAAGLLAGLAGCETYPHHGDVRVVFTDSDRRIIHDYYRVDYRALPPGLARKGKLPPGHAKRFRTHQPLPPDVEWRHLPGNVERQLSRLPDGYVRIVVGASVAIMNVRTRILFDVIDDIDD